MDLLIALALLLPASVMMAIVIVAIKLESPGPGLFLQTRVGLGGRHFILVKLRTMYCGTGDIPSHFSRPDQITRLGRWLRRLKIDELPQLINILKGEMSLVGPRPCLPTQIELIEARRALGLLDIRPGITGPAQIAGIDMSDPSRLAKADARYLVDRSLRNDLWILLRTVTGSGMGDAIGNRGGGN